MENELIKKLEERCDRAVKKQMDSLYDALYSDIQSRIDICGEGPLSRDIKSAIRDALTPFNERICELFREREREKFLDRFADLFEFIERH